MGDRDKKIKALYGEVFKQKGDRKSALYLAISITRIRYFQVFK